LLLACAARGGEAPPAERFAGQIKECKDSLAWLKEYTAGQTDRAEQAPSFARVDLPVLNAQIEQETTAWANAMAAWEKGDEQTARKLVDEAREIGGRRSTLDHRLDLRHAQGNETPSEDGYEAFNWRPRLGVAGIMEAKKRVSEAYGKLAEATVPGADAQLIVKLEEEVSAARLEVDVAEMKANWMQEDQSWAMRDAVSSPGLTAAQQKLNEYRKEREATYRKIRQAQRELERYDRQNGALLTERDRQAELARQARERAAQGK
jgi:hypothetical protein